MKTLRLALSVLTIVLLSLGYAASQYATLNGNAVDWAQKVDQPPVVSLALLLFLGALVLALIKDKEEAE